MDYNIELQLVAFQKQEVGGGTGIPDTGVPLLPQFSYLGVLRVGT